MTDNAARNKKAVVEALTDAYAGRDFRVCSMSDLTIAGLVIDCASLISSAGPRVAW
jgi:hypothetical protein